MGENRRLLLIHDDEQERAAIREAVAGGYELHETCCTERVLEAIATTRPAVVLADVRLLLLRGMEVLAELNRRADRPLVILISGDRSERLVLEALRAGAYDYVHRERDPEELRQALRRAFETHALMDERNERAKACEMANEQLQLRLSQLRETGLSLLQAETMASLGRLVAGIAHEINTPVGSLRSNTELLERALLRLRQTITECAVMSSSPAAPKAIQTLETLQNLLAVDRLACDRILELIRSLKTFVRLDEAERKMIDLHAGLESTLKLAAYELRQRVKLEKDYGELPEVECFPQQLNQVFLNLVMNAAQAIDGQGVIRIRTRHETGPEGPESGRVTVAISDTGRGIPKDFMSRIFEPGFTTKAVGEGSGLGLSICRKIVVQNHGGELTISSEVGKGTTVTVSLPVRLAASKRNNGSPAAAVPPFLAQVQAEAEAAGRNKAGKAE
jgi:signal transduction histidine kinase